MTLCPFDAGAAVDEWQLALEERYFVIIGRFVWDMRYNSVTFKNTFSLTPSQVCSSFDCKDFNVSGPERMLPSQQYQLKADVSNANNNAVLIYQLNSPLGQWWDWDSQRHQSLQCFPHKESRTCGITPPLIDHLISRLLAVQAEFARLSGETKTEFKWRWFLKPLKLSLALLLPTVENNYAAGSTNHVGLMSSLPNPLQACLQTLLRLVSRSWLPRCLRPRSDHLWPVALSLLALTSSMPA